MFEAAELGRKISKKEFEATAETLRLDLLRTQLALRQADFPVVLVLAGVDGAGKSETLNLLQGWLDPRGISTRAYGPPSDEESERPEFWRYWRDLPPRGQIGVFISSWYSRPVLDRVYRRSSSAELDQQLDRIVSFERALADDGALIIKFWLHVGKQVQRKIFKRLQKDPDQSWRVTKRDWDNWRRFDKFVAAAERTITRTSTGEAPWMIVEGTDHRYASVSVATQLHEAIQRQLRARELEREVAAKASKRRGAKVGKKAARVGAQRTLLQSLDLSQSLTKREYERELDRQRARLALLFRRAKAQGTSAILVFQGWDAAGKGGAIRRMVGALDARDYAVIPIGAPTDEERARHYLWRFWRHLPRAGRVTVFDRSWYGRVLVERVEGFASEGEWKRAYAEINHFEEELTRHGIVLVKYWLHISEQEQLQRFEARKASPAKSWKLTEEDWRNRTKWPLYEAAVNEMVERTSTGHAPWTLVEANDKRFARIKVISTFCERLQRTLGRD